MQLWNTFSLAHRAEVTQGTEQPLTCEQFQSQNAVDKMPHTTILYRYRAMQMPCGFSQGSQGHVNWTAFSWLLTPASFMEDIATVQVDAWRAGRSCAGREVG